MSLGVNRARTCVLMMVAVAALLAGAQPAAAKLRAPGLAAPPNDSVTDAMPLFQWNAVKGAQSYVFELSADRAFGSIVNKGRISTRNTAAALEGTLPNGVYYWRVRGIDAKAAAGVWSSVRSFDRDWGAPPQLLEPTDDLSVTWPTLPLVLRWAAVPRATKYLVTVATDPSLAQPVIGTVAKPVETQGTVLALPGALAPGRYYWAVTPVDANGYKGSRSRVGGFTWSWPSHSNLRTQDTNPTAEVFDPLLQWDAIPGAAKYEIEVNPTAEFTPASRVFLETVYGTSVSPRIPLPNNRYHWRVRAIDPNGNAGVWNVGEPFVKEFDDVAITVPNARIRSHTTADLGANPLVSTVLIAWDPVPGAEGYELQWARHLGGGCDWAVHKTYKTPVTAWTNGPDGPPSSNPEGPGSTAWPKAKAYTDDFDAGNTYCVRVLAYDAADNISEWTYVNGVNPTTSNLPTFRYAEPPAGDNSCATAISMPPGSYHGPEQGVVTARTPYFSWDPQPGAGSYFVVVARDPVFTEVTEVGFTDTGAYAPRVAYTDETTSYYWAVMPTRMGNGTCVFTPVTEEPRGDFQKRSVPPSPEEPGEGQAVSSQPLFRWLPAETAGIYRFQVATDPQFKDLLDDVDTASTAILTTTTYPADTVLYWRVQAKGLNWSPTRTFRRSLPVPVPSAGNPTGGETIPVLSWEPVAGAISYDFHVDQADGTVRDFTVSASRLTPTLFYGTGIWKWKVRATFPGKTPISGAYSRQVDFVRRINAPTAARVLLNRNRLAFTWDPDIAATKYRVELSRNDSFSGTVDAVTTPNTAWAPLLTNPAYRDGGRLYWRLAVVDSGGSIGAYKTGIVALTKGLRINIEGGLRRGQRARVKVKVTDANGKAVAKAKVRVSGLRLRGTRRTSKKGTVSFSLRPRRRGTVTFTVSRRGYRTTTATVIVG